jgi:endonuclease YncB( thermonuclease family)
MTNQTKPPRTLKQNVQLAVFVLVLAIPVCCVLIFGASQRSNQTASLPTTQRLQPAIPSSTTKPVEIKTTIPKGTRTTAPQLTATDNPLEVTLSVPTQSSGQGRGQVTVDSCIAPQNYQTGRVVEVVDGDTIKVLIDGAIFPVRYIGMDTPESTFQHEPYGKEASQENAKLVSEKVVILFRDKSETDKYDRLLRYVYVGNTFVNRALVSTGYAEAKDYPPDTACSETLHAAELDARAALLGMWSGSQPTQITRTTQIAIPPGSNGSVVIVGVNKRSEYVTLKNMSSSPVNLKGWTLLSERGSQSCPLGGTIPAGGTINIWSKTGPDGYSCGFSSDIWNNSQPDPAVLYNPQGKEVSRY